MEGTAFENHWDRFVATHLAGFDEQQLVQLCGVAKAAFVAATDRAAAIVLNPVGSAPLDIQIRTNAA
jgi:hypothetical protein